MRSKTKKIKIKTNRCRSLEAGKRVCPASYRHHPAPAAGAPMPPGSARLRSDRKGVWGTVASLGTTASWCRERRQRLTVDCQALAFLRRRRGQLRRPISWSHRSHCVAGGCIDSFMLFTWASAVRPTSTHFAHTAVRRTACGPRPPGSCGSPDQVPAQVPVRLSSTLCRMSCCGVASSREHTMPGSTKVASSCRRSACMQDT